MAAFEDVAPGGFEVAGVPGVGDIAGTAGEVEQEVDLALGVVTTEAPHVAQVPRVHADEQVEAVVVGTRHLARGLAGTADAVLGEFTTGRGIDGVANLLGGGGCRLDIILALAACTGHQVFHHELCHRAATDVAVAYKQYPFHISATKVQKKSFTAIGNPYFYVFCLVVSGECCIFAA